MNATATEIAKETHNGKIHFLFFSLHKNIEVRIKKSITSELTRVIPRKKESKIPFLKKEMSFIKILSNNKLKKIDAMTMMISIIPLFFIIS